MRNFITGMFIVAITFVSCSKDPEAITVTAPDSYQFTRGGESTVSYSGQLTRLDMHSLLKSEVSKGATASISLAKLNAMFNHQANNDDFSNGKKYSAADLNASGKNISGATAYSVSYSEEVKTQFNDWFSQAAINSNPTIEGSKGIAGYADRQADGSKKILIDENGLEYVQLISKSLMGAMQMDQMINKYLSPERLDVDNDVNVEGKSYTQMEHHWDEAFGYSGLHENALSYATLDDVPAEDLDLVDRFWGEYIYAVNTSIAGEGIKDRLISAFLKGREAIAVKAYDVRDEQAKIIKQELSNVCAMRAIYYIKKGIPNVLETNPNDRANAYHALSEAYGFIYSLQFSNDGNDQPFYTKSEVETMLSIFNENDGLYGANIESALQALEDQISEKFSISRDDV